MPFSRLAAVGFSLYWHGPLAQRRDRLYSGKLNFWREGLLAAREDPA
jgi:hypothetical protein